MPYAPDAPPTGNIPAPDTTKALDTYHVTKIEISVDPNNAARTQVRVAWSKGYMETGTFKSVESTVTLLEGQDLIDKITSATGGGTIYDEVKFAIWALLKDLGHVEAGATT